MTSGLVRPRRSAGARRQLPVIDSALCTGCGDCIARCPAQALCEPVNTACAKCVKYCLAMEVPCIPTRVVVDVEGCDGCGLCAQVCTEGAISMQVEDRARNRARSKGRTR